MNPSSNHAQQQKHLQTQTNGLNYHYNGQILMNQILVETLCIASIHITLLNFSHNKPQITHFPSFSKNFEMQQKEGHRTTPGVQLNPKNSLPCYTEQHMFHATQSSTCSMLHRAAHVSNCQFDTINTNPVWVKLSWKGNWLNDNSPSLCKKRRKATWIEDYPWHEVTSSMKNSPPSKNQVIVPAFEDFLDFSDITPKASLCVRPQPLPKSLLLSTERLQNWKGPS